LVGVVGELKVGGSEIYLRKIEGILTKFTVHEGGGGGGEGKIFLILLNFPPAHPYLELMNSPLV